jgi:ribosomal protein S12 methylthiotransferase
VSTSVFLTTLGCPKNLVDSETILGLLGNAGLEISKDPLSADILCLNTCAFIKEAKEESIDSILNLVKLKKQNPKKKVIVIGCLVHRYLEELKKEIPEVDNWVSLKEISALPKIIETLSPSSHLRGEGERSPGEGFARKLLTPKHYAYLKIAEGCSNRCSYCVIPDIRGSFRSRNPDSILEEAYKLSKKGVKEINIIAQDSTNYGADISNTLNITLLLRELCKINGIKWIRLLYTHPAHITEQLINEIASQKKICKYMDMPLQHIDDAILIKMGRKITSLQIKKLINMIRNKIPGIILRTSFIVGFPGETDKQFANLLKFVKETKFQKLGVFKYSREEQTPAYKLPNQIPLKTKEKRYNEIMQAQKDISRELNRKLLGKAMEVLIEDIHDKKQNTWIGRTYMDAPDIDGVIYITGKNIKKGDIIKAKITEALDYDLIGGKI